MNPLLQVFWQRLFPDAEQAGGTRRRRVASDEAQSPASSSVFLVLRRMRSPLIVLVVIYAVSVLGLVLIPGSDAEGKPWSMSFFHAFYFMSYTATTIGFGEIPYAFTDAQRMWVTFSIYLTVLGWAYAIGTLLALMQDRGFRAAIAAQRLVRQVARLTEPFYIIVGYGQTGRTLCRSLDALGRRFVVIDHAEQRIDQLQIHDYRADVPSLVADARNPLPLRQAGLDHPRCRGLFVLTGDDEANLAATMAARLLRPDLPVLARTLSRSIAERMSVVGTPYIVNPFDRFGDHLALAIRAPSTIRVMTWLTGVPGTELPAVRTPPSGHWVLCGYGRFGREVAPDLVEQGIDISIIQPEPGADCGTDIVEGLGTEPEVLRRAGVERAAGLIAGTDNDTTNLSIVVAARMLKRDLFVVARQNQRATAALFAAAGIDVVMVPSEVVARECMARLVTPHLMRFFDIAHAHDDAWSAQLVDRVSSACGLGVPLLWTVRLNARRAPALARWLDGSAHTLRLGDLVRDPAGRDQRLPLVALLVRRGEETIAVPPDDFLVARGDEILFAGRPEARRRLEDTSHRDATRDYVLLGRQVPVGWVWRKLAKGEAA